MTQLVIAMETSQCLFFNQWQLTVTAADYSELLLT